ncbi:hypothetical protein D4764_08G0009720 [Takifugu flavidus]|uniref:Uncharacterized protein n=1 Tax=Takifugu flavidus TaxID=433684 RepID=A0A5C6MQF0_9TELE|nr:hypothetical protein D4764_08G0009720 [Takifugu flavidus]
MDGAQPSSFPFPYQALIRLCSRFELYPSYALHCPTFLISSGDRAAPDVEPAKLMPDENRKHRRI